MEPGSEAEKSRAFVLKLIRGSVLAVVVFGSLLFLPAGTVRWWRAWVLIGLHTAAACGTMVDLYYHNRALLEERAKPPLQRGQPLADRIALLLFLAAYIVLVVFTALDVFHLHLMRKPGTTVSSAGLAIFLAGWWVMYRSLRENAFATSVVRHQEERHHTVIDTGVYSVVRHPMYAGGMLLAVGIPLWLESYAGALMAAVPIAMISLRAMLEERFLRRELAGYDAYMHRVRHRFVPFVW